MSTTRSVVADRVSSALSSAQVADAAGVSSAVWASPSVPHVFRGFSSGFISGRSRGRLPFIDYEITEQPYALETRQGGMVSTSLRITAHAGGRDLAAVGERLDSMIVAALSAIRSEDEDNYMAIGNETVSEMEVSPWGQMMSVVLQVEHSYGREKYEQE